MLVDNKETLKSLVITEATKLKKHATDEELSQLDFNKLDPNDKFKCIYGQMTGCCFSERAHELILKCASRVYVESESNTGGGILENGVLNGKPTPVNGESRNNMYFSPIEKFIYGKGNKTNTKKLINFLKGKTSELVF